MMPPSRVMQTLVMACALFLLVGGGASSATGPCPRPCVCFTADNGQPVANCTGLPHVKAEAAVAEWPQTVLRVRFDRASQVMLKNRAFDRFPRLTYLDVEGGQVRYVDKAAFDGLPELIELNLVAAGVRKLHRYAVAGHGRLAFLSLKGNPGLAVGPSFVVSRSVTELDVSECRLKSLKRVYFAGLPNLKYLFAAGNELKTLGPQFGPPALKYANLARNRIESVDDDLDAYKHLRTLDVTGNPFNCTCELADLDRRLDSRGVAFGDTVTCANTGKPLGHTAEACAMGGGGGGDDDEMMMMMGDGPAADMYAQDHLIKINAEAMAASAEETDGSGSGSGDGGFVITDDLGWKSSMPRPDAVGTETANGAGQTTSNGTAAGSPVEYVERTEDPVPVIPAVSATVAASTITAETAAPPTAAPPTAEPSTAAPPTAEPPSAEPPTAAPPSVEPPTAAPPSAEPPTAAPPSSEPPTAAPPSAEPPTAAPPSAELPTGAPPSAEPPTEQPVVAVRAPPTVQAATDGGNSSAARSGGGAIVSQTIQAPEDERDVRTKVADYLVSNVGVTGTAALLAVIIVAIVYKAVCVGRRSRSNAAPDAGKTVELKEIKYTAANTTAAEEQRQEQQRRRDDDDDDSPADSAEENALLDERLSDYDEDGVCDDDDDESPPVAATGNGLLSSVMDAVVKNNGCVPAVAPSNAAPNGGSPTVPTRVIVKLTETPKASKPITVDNVH